MHSRLHSTPRKGFTLVEMLVVVVIMTVLAALAFALSRRAVKSANSMSDMASMRQIYQMFPIYAGDNNGDLPGPINTGVKAVYGPQSTGRLSFYIASYLGYSNPKRDDFLEAMSFSWQKDEASRMAPCAYIRENVPLANQRGRTFKPFGHPLRRGDDRVPKKMVHALSQISVARTWVISDLDQLHPDVANPGWKSTIPKEMSHGNYRLAIYFDGHAGKLDVDNNPY